MAHDNWIVYRRLNPQACLRLFCFSYAGGGASVYRTWANNLPLAVELCPVQLPGRENRLKEPAYTQLEPLVESLLQALQPYLDMPFAFFGHSMGGLISFELARRLRRSETRPAQLFISGRRAPQVPDREPPIHHLPKAEFIKELRRLQGTPEAVLQNAELMELVLPCLRADFSVCETYIHSASAPLECPISVFGGVDDSKITLEDLAAWREHTQGALVLRTFPGDHFFLHTARASLLQALHSDLVDVLKQVTAQQFALY